MISNDTIDFVKNDIVVFSFAVLFLIIIILLIIYKDIKMGNYSSFINNLLCNINVWLSRYHEVGNYSNIVKFYFTYVNFINFNEYSYN